MDLKNNYLDDIYVSHELDPFVHLAHEDFLMRNKDFHGKRILYLWRSRPSIVLGRFQNPWLECDLKACHRDGLHIVRRQSGGGTVYHDLGNLNVSFIGTVNKEENFKFVLSALQNLGVQAEVNERNDILVGGLKISGSAFKKTRHSEIHHMTLLVNSDVSLIKKYLHHKQLDISSKSIKSKRSEMTRLIDVQSGLEMSDLLSAFTSMAKESSSLGLVAEKESFYRSWEWVFGETPKFKINRGGEVVEVVKGLLKGTRFESF